MSRIYLLETEQQVEDLEKRFGIGDGIYIALSPFAMNALDSRNIKYNIPEDFYTEEDLWKVALEVYEIEKKIVQKLDNFAFSKSEELRKRNLKLYTNYNSPLYIVLDTVFVRVFQLKAMLESVRPDKIFCYRSEKYPFYNWIAIGYMGFDKREFLCSRILEEGGWKEDICFIALDKSTKEDCLKKEPFKIYQRVNAFKTWLRNTLPALRQIKKYGFLSFPKILPLYLKKNINVTLIGGEYEWGECELYFARNGVRVKKLDISHDDSMLYHEDGELEQEISGEIKDLFIYRGINLASLLVSRMAFIYKDELNRCIKAYDDARKHIDKENPAALLFSTLPIPELRSAALAFRGKKIPVFCKAHGVTGITEQIKTLDNDLLYSSYYLVNGEMASKFYQRHIKDYASNNLKVVSTGSPNLERLKSSHGKLPLMLKKWLKDKGGDDARKIGLYVTTHYFQNFYHVNCPGSYFDTILFRSQKQILNFFKERKDCFLIWKLHPNRISDRPPHIENGSENVFVIRDEAAFTDLLDVPDFIIIDAPFTACQQTMTRKVPLFIVMKHVFYHPEARAMLEKRAVCCYEPEELMKKVEDFLSCGRYEADLNNDDFFKAYGNSYSGGLNAAQKTVTEVMKVIGTQR